MIFQICRASDSFMEPSSLPFFSPHPDATWDKVTRSWIIQMSSPGAIVNLRETIGVPIKIDGDMELPRITIEDLNDLIGVDAIDD